MALRMYLPAAAIGVVLCDVEQRFLDRGMETIGKNLDREVAKNKISAADKAASAGTDRAGGRPGETGRRAILWWKRPRRNSRSRWKYFATWTEYAGRR